MGDLKLMAILPVLVLSSLVAWATPSFAARPYLTAGLVATSDRHSLPRSASNPLSSGYVERTNANGSVDVFKGQTLQAGSANTSQLLASLDLSIPLPFGVSLVLPNDQAISAGATYSNQPGVAIEVDPPASRCTGNGVNAAIQVDQVTHDATGLTTSYAIQFFCDVGNGTSYTGAFAYNVSPSTPHRGYYAYESNGTITGFGNDNYLNYLGDLSVMALNKPIVGMAITADAAG